jgi:hypothetical protein
MGPASASTLACPTTPTFNPEGRTSMPANSITTQTTRIRGFTLGQTFITPGAEEALQIAGQTAIELGSHCLVKTHSPKGLPHSALPNRMRYACAEDNRLMSNYRIREGQRLWIITEADRSACYHSRRLHRDFASLEGITRERVSKG